MRISGLACTGFQEYHIVKKSTRSLSTTHVESPWRLIRPSVISIIGLYKEKGKVSDFLQALLSSR